MAVKKPLFCFEFVNIKYCCYNQKSQCSRKGNTRVQQKQYCAKCTFAAALEFGNAK